MINSRSFSRKSKVSVFSALFVLFLCCFVPSQAKAMYYSEFEKSLQQTTNIVKNETKNSVLLELNGSAAIFGDIHGDIAAATADVNEARALLEKETVDYVIFTGDYVDRGGHSLEVLCLLAEFKKTYPERVYLLRGNHELPVINRVYGLCEELNNCGLKTESEVTKIQNLLDEFFDYLPYAAIVNSNGEQTLVMHGGIPELEEKENLITILRDVKGGKFRANSRGFGENFKVALGSSNETSDRQAAILYEILWNEPKIVMGYGFISSMRGAGRIFGKDALVDFCTKHNISRIVRGHSHDMGGRKLFDDKLVTVMSNWKFYHNEEEIVLNGAYSIVSNSGCEVFNITTNRENFEQKDVRFTFESVWDDDRISKLSYTGVAHEVLPGFRFYRYGDRWKGSYYTFVITDPKRAKVTLEHLGLSESEIFGVFNNTNKPVCSDGVLNSFVKSWFTTSTISQLFGEGSKFTEIYNKICKCNTDKGHNFLMVNVTSSPGNSLFFNKEQFLSAVNGLDTDCSDIDVFKDIEYKYNSVEGYEREIGKIISEYTPSYKMF